MAASPLSNSDGVIKYSITADGTALKDSVNVLMIEVISEVNRVPSARIIVSDGDMPGKDFPLSTESCFKPGTSIEIKAGYASSETLIFSGLVIGMGISIGMNNDSSLVIECKDKCVAMTIARTSENYTSKTDSQIIEEIIGNYSGLEKSVSATSSQYNELVQFNCTDWDFVLSRAEANGYVICVDAGKLTIGEPQVTGTGELTVTYGEDLIDFSADLDARYQLSSVSGVCWDPATQKVQQEKVEAQTLNKQGDLSSSDLAATLSIDNFRLQTSNTLDSASLKAWAKGQQIKSALARIQGTMKFQGSATAKIGSLIEIAGVGSRFNGLVYVSRVHHELVDGQWLTDIEFGMSPHWSSEHRDISAPPASGLLPAVEGLQIGVVMKLDGDPSGQNRIQVQVPVLQASTEGVWARLATFYASEDIGNFFIPEIGDEVVLGYFNNNPSEPVILGSLYSSKRKPAYDLTAENNIKAIITKSKLKIEFNEEDKVITIITPGENKVVISDKDKSIVLEDQNSNKLELNSSGITLDSPKDINITAKGKMTLSAVGEMSLSSNADLKLAGLNINQTAQVGFVAKGSASAELSASGQTTIKGAMVMIN
ncbi:type VI secretion system tip protein VgrG [Shewanella psychropiezotolerans]|uniref:Type VI secretion system tip protein VgrG n=1 Tax=Shewanella psychropiezotolerans TaxID=2593655 RepID=A0ABX5X2I9_9GAMM|nr:MULTISPECIES: type VI secretion system tip protein VgrG [Shewanella]MPY23415.1 type VI secretion system tip protein VgrG [Shewanella sp. YLB-07]QDO85499.1 type VI secretion system tip protein VgrG [Shewanella psychropiezotolerans]